MTWPKSARNRIRAEIWSEDRQLRIAHRGLFVCEGDCRSQQVLRAGAPNHGLQQRRYQGSGKPAPCSVTRDMPCTAQGMMRQREGDWEERCGVAVLWPWERERDASYLGLRVPFHSSGRPWSWGGAPVSQGQRCCWGLLSSPKGSAWAELKLQRPVWWEWMGGQRPSSGGSHHLNRVKEVH